MMAAPLRAAPSKLGIGLVYAYRYTFGLLVPAGHLQVPSELLGVRDPGAPQARALQGVGAGLLARPPL